MLISRLCEFAHRESLIADPTFEMRPVAWVLVLDDDGTPLDLSRTVGQPGRGGKARPKEMAVPKVGNRNDGRTPCFAADTLPRVVPGWSERLAEEESKKKGQEVKPKPAEVNTRENFIALIREAADSTGAPSLMAIRSFYDTAARDPSSLAPLHEKLLTEKAKPSDWITFRRHADVDVNVLDAPEVQDFWRKQYAAARKQQRGQATQLTCLSCGNIAPIAKSHDKLKGVPGGNPAGVSLISSDKAAFGSYGLEKSLTSPVCEDCVEAYTRALNELLSRDSTHCREGDLVFCFWTREPTDDDWTVLSRADPEQVKRLLQQPRTPSRDPAAVNPNRFYALSLSGVGGRAMVREWIEETVPRVRENLCQWFGDLGVVLDRPLKDKQGVVWASPGDEYHAWPLWQLNRALGRRGDRGTEVIPHLPAVLFQSAIRGRPFPDSVLAAAVRRIQAEHEIPPARAALLRLALNRTWQSTQKGRRAMSSGLDVDRCEPGYLCGRMLAVLARLQYLALGSTNATIVDRYYGAASSAPVTVFGRLSRLAQSHLGKLGSSRKGAAVNIEKDMEEILGKLADWPRQLSLQDQALFALGFYHQRAEYRRRPKDQGGSEGDEPIPVTTEEASEAS